MLQRYKEIVYGLMFGLGASAIDIVMHASMEQTDWWTELVRPQPMMLAYRLFFLAFGLGLGWLLWRKNKAERNYRSVAEAFAQLQRRIVQPSVLIHLNMQLLLTRTDLHLPPDAEGMIRDAYEGARELGVLTQEKLTVSK